MRKKCKKSEKSLQKICIYQKIVVPLHRHLKRSDTNTKQETKKITIMKATNAIKRIEKAANELNANSHENTRGSNAYKLILSALENGRKEIRPCYTSGHGRFTTNLNYTSSACRLLEKAGIKYTLTNDSPRGGLTGNKITLTHIEF